MDAWATNDLAVAVDEVAAHDANTAPGDPQERGWVKPEKYDYETFRDRERHFEGNAVRYEWDGEEGDIGPELPELEDILFGDTKHAPPSGIDFSKVTSIQLVQEGPERITPISNFADCGFHPAINKNINLAGYKIPTPIQRYTIPAIKNNFDVIGIAQTGSGKTAAYMIPILDKLMGKAKKLAAPRPNPATFQPGVTKPVRAEPLVVVLVPTRELAIQIFNEARRFCYRSMLRPCVVYGGGPVSEQARQLERGCDVLIASPGRLIDFIDRPHTLTLRRLKYMVIDEADEMLHSDWEEDFQKIMAGGEQDEGNVKYSLFSATFPKQLRDLAKMYLNEAHVRFRVGRAGSAVQSVEQIVIEVDPREKKTRLLEILESHPPARTIIFVNSKRTADHLDDFLFNKGLPCTSMHGDRTQREREDAMRSFRGGAAPILIATGVSARGIDVPNVCHVINYDLPSTEYGGIEEYTHRIGRTGRIGHRGLATSFYTERDETIGSVLTRTMLETKQEIPDFLQQYVPQGDAVNHLQFEADSDFDPTDMPGASETFGDDGGFGDGVGGGDWGGGSDAGADARADFGAGAGDAW
ncbi:hypothetical protein MKZ38_007822 [Zalerion maritima]|uniref:RNA helicase n=1 Tax=Zalerion maritima TaxID=339359 RepID=A0AAD5RHB6_9PEZI|nr:hypothetical protein MKZ38_007822 [Zalerion maritima]